MAHKYTHRVFAVTASAQALTLALALILTLAAVAFAQNPPASNAPPPDLTGTWKLNIARSKPPKNFHIKHETITITCSGQKIKMRYEGRGVSTYIADGKERSDLQWSGVPVSYKVEWQGNALMIEEILQNTFPDHPDFHPPPDDKKTYWRVSADGQTLLRETDDPKGFLLYEKVGN